MQTQQQKPATKEYLSVGEWVILILDAIFCLACLVFFRLTFQIALLVGAILFGTSTVCILIKQQQVARWLHTIPAVCFLGIALVCGYVLFNECVLHRDQDEMALRAAIVIGPFVLGLGVLFSWFAWLLKRMEGS